MRLKSLITSALLLVLHPFSAVAETNASEDPSRRNWIFLGGNIGYSDRKSSIVGENDISGHQWQLKALYSRYFDRWVIDLGGGFFLNHLEGENKLGGDVRVATQGLFLELSPRYRLSKRWQVGAVLNPLFGSDVSFDENESVDVSSTALLLGPRLEYETEGEKNRWRFGLQALKKMNATERNLWAFQVDVQFGFPWGPTHQPAPARYEPKEEIASRPEPLQPAPALPVEEPTRTTVVRTSAKSLKLTLPEAVLRFSTARSDVRREATQLISEVAQYLGRNKANWGSLRIEGHSDIRGGRAYNKELSLARADSVARIMRKNGVGSAPIQTIGHGPDRPLDRGNSDAAYARNRRVEIHLLDVKDADTVVKELEELTNR